MTSNPSIFEKAIAESHDYDEDIKALALEGKGVQAIYENLSQRDLQSAKFNAPFDKLMETLAQRSSPHLAKAS
jgi:transaldolase